MAYRPFVLALLLFAIPAVPASAQTGEGAVVSGLVGVAAARGATGLGFSGSARYSLNRVIGFELEVAMINNLESDTGFSTSPFARIDRPGSRVTFFTNNVRLEIPTTSNRVIPYVVAGGGIGTIRERDSAIYALAPFDLSALTGLLPGSALTSILPVPSTSLPGPSRNAFRYTTAMALTLGGGARLPVTGHLSIDLDLRYVTLMGNGGFGIGRFGGGASYRF